MTKNAHFPRPLDVLSPDEDKDEDVDRGEEGHGYEPRDDQPRPVDVVVDVPRVQPETCRLNIKRNVSLKNKTKYFRLRRYDAV